MRGASLCNLQRDWALDDSAKERGKIRGAEHWHQAQTFASKGKHEYESELFTDSYLGCDAFLWNEWDGVL